jgi:hypothetical protein
MPVFHDAARLIDAESSVTRVSFTAHTSEGDSSTTQPQIGHPEQPETLPRLPAPGATLTIAHPTSAFGKTTVDELDFPAGN